MKWNTNCKNWEVQITLKSDQKGRQKKAHGGRFTEKAAETKAGSRRSMASAR